MFCKTGLWNIGGTPSKENEVEKHKVSGSTADNSSTIEGPLAKVCILERSDDS